jgi:hypothetical protein
LEVGSRRTAVGVIACGSKGETATRSGMGPCTILGKGKQNAHARKDNEKHCAQRKEMAKRQESRFLDIRSVWHCCHLP